MDVHIYTKNPAQVIYNADTLTTTSIDEINKVELIVPRKNEFLNFSLLSDSVKKDIFISPQLSSNFYYGILMFPYTLIDFTNSKRYTYNNLLAFDQQLAPIYMGKRNHGEKDKDMAEYIKQVLDDPSNKPNRYNQKKGSIYLNFAFPFIYPGHNIIKPTSSSYLETGSAIGFSGGLDYYYRKNRFINLTASASYYGLGGDGFYYYDEEDTSYDDYRIYNISLTHNHRYKKLSFGYGLSHSYIQWEKDSYINNEKVDYVENYQNQNYNYIIHHHQSKKYATLGLSLNTYFNFTHFMAFGVVYKPTFVRLNSIMDQRFCYEHQISFDLAFKIRLK